MELLFLTSLRREEIGGGRSPGLRSIAVRGLDRGRVALLRRIACLLCALYNIRSLLLMTLPEEKASGCNLK